MKALGATAIAAACMAWCTAAAAQDAAPFIPMVEVVLASRGIPANGALLLSDNTGSLEDPDGPEVMPVEHVVVTGPGGEPVEGSLEHVTWHYWAWRPAAELTLGEHLIESTGGPPLHARDGVLSTTFDVIAPLDLAPPIVQSTASITVASVGEGARCCEELTDDGLEQGYCTYGIYSYALLTATLTSAAEPVALDQFLYAVGPVGFTPDGSYWWWGYAPQLSFHEQAEEYCYEVHAISIVDSSLHVLEGTERCAPHGSLEPFEPGLLPRTDPELFFDRTRCTVPPAVFETMWCEHNADCEDATDDAGCIAFDHVCNGGPEPMWPSAGIDAGMPVVDAGSEPEPEPEPEPDAGTAHEPSAEPASGCSCRVASSRPASGAHALLGLGLAVLLLRVTRRRPRSA